MTLLDRVLSCGNYSCEEYYPLLVDGHKVGQVSTVNASVLTDFKSVFELSGAEIRLSDEIRGFSERSIAIREVTEKLSSQGLISGWRNELYPVAPKFAVSPLFDIERAAVPFFGIRSYGVHINGWVKVGEDLHMWIGRRSRTKATGAGQLDQIVAGGLPSGVSLMNNVIKECQEEACIDAPMASRAVPVGTVSYITKRKEGLRDDVLFNYDLCLPIDFNPINMDGEVEEFMLWPMSKVSQEVAKEGVFKFNSALVIIDFLVRHGFVEPDSPGYIEIINGLHR